MATGERWLSPYLKIGAAPTHMGGLWVDASLGAPHSCPCVPGALTCPERCSVSHHVSENWQSWERLLDLGDGEVDGKSAWCSRPSPRWTAGLDPECLPTHLLFSELIFHWGFHCMVHGGWMCVFPASSADYWLCCGLTQSEENLLIVCLLLENIKGQNLNQV